MAQPQEPVTISIRAKAGQRDLIDQTLIEAAERGGEHDLADALRRERAMPMP